MRFLSVVSRAGPWQVAGLVGAGGAIIDQATKRLAVQALGSGRVVDLPGPFHFQLTFNAGAAFGIPAPWWLFPAVTVLVLLLVSRSLGRARGFIEPIAYGLLVAGALGNITDRFTRPHPGGVGRGEVVDFIASTFFPTFNVADVWINIGFGLLLVAAYRHERAERAAES
ncbi:MAG: signal peptidase II [Nitriliruptorales bacterium]